MELRQLRYFLTVLRFGSINRAAAALNMTQPSLSHSIKALERSVGAELIIRSGGGIRATAIGEEFALHANNIIREADKAKAVVATSRGAGAGRIRLAVLSAFSNSVVPRMLSDFFSAGHSTELDVFVHTANRETIVKKIARADWDLVLTLDGSSENYPPEIGSKFLGVVSSSVYCGATHPLANMKNLTLGDMAPYRWIASQLGVTDTLLSAGSNNHLVVPTVCLRTDSMTLIPSLLVKFPFLCMAPDIAVSADVQSGALVRLDQESLQSSSSLVVLYSNLSGKTSQMRALISIISDHARKLGLQK